MTDNTNTQNDAASGEVSIDLGSGGDNIPDDIGKHIDAAIEAQDGKATTTPPAADKGAEASAAKPTAGADSTSGAKDAAAQQPANKEAAKDGSEARGPKDLVIKGANGEDIVIKGGAERRFYEQLRTTRDRLGLVESQLTASQQNEQRLRAELNTMQQTVQTVQGMRPDEMALAARIFRDFQSDPVGTLKKMLADAVAAGYKVEQIGVGVDAAAIERIIEAKLGSTLTAQGPTDAQIVAEAQAEANQFFGRFPDAKLHEPILVKIMQDHPGVDVYTAYFNLRGAFTERGLDWDRPLDVQLQEQLAAKDAQQQQVQQTQQTQNDQPGMPGGRPAHVPSQEADKLGTVAHESTSKDDIIRDAMREAGIQI